MASTAGLMVEFKAKADSVQAAFKNIETESNKAILKNKELNDSFAKTTNTASTGFQSLATSLKSLGVIAGLGVLTHQVAALAEAGGELYDTTSKLRISIGDFQRLSLVGKEAGVATDSLQTAIFKMNVVLGQAAQGSKPAIDSLAQLGVSAQDFVGLDTNQKFLKMIDLLKQVSDSSLQDADSMAIFGRSAKELSGFFTTDLRSGVAELKNLGYGLTDIQGRNLDHLTDSFHRFYEMAKSSTMALVADLAPGIEKLGEQLASAASKAATVLSKGISTWYEGVKEGLIAGDEFLNSTAAGVGKFIQGVNNGTRGSTFADGRPAHPNGVLSFLGDARSEPQLASSIPGISGEKILTSIIPSIKQAFEDNAKAVEEATKQFKAMSSALEGSALGRSSDVGKAYQDYATAKYVPGAGITSSRWVNTDVGGYEQSGNGIPNEIGGGLNQNFADSLRNAFETAQDKITKVNINILEQASKRYKDLTPLIDSIKSTEDSGQQLQQIKVTQDLLETLKKADLGDKAAKVDLNVKISVAEGFIVSSEGNGDINKLVYNAVQDAFVDAAGRTGFRGIR